MLAVRYQLDMARAEAQRQRLENARRGDALAEVASRLRTLESHKPAATVDGTVALRSVGYGHGATRRPLRAMLSEWPFGMSMGRMATSSGRCTAA